MKRRFDIITENILDSAGILEPIEESLDRGNSFSFAMSGWNSMFEPQKFKLIYDGLPRSRKDGLSKREKDSLVTKKIKEFLDSILVPYKRSGLNYPNLSLLEISRSTGLTLSEVEYYIKEFSQYFTYESNGKTYKPTLFLAELPIKKLIRDSRYQSRPPGGGAVQRSRFQKKNLKALLGDSDIRRSRTYIVWEELRPDIENLDEKPLPTPNDKRLVENVTRVFDMFINLGPFYGAGNEPTWRVCATPLELPYTIYEQSLRIGKMLKQASALVQDQPLSVRVDTILGENGELRFNEIECVDGAEAMMTAEAMIYIGVVADKLSPGYFIEAVLKKLDISNLQTPIQIARLYRSTNIETRPYVSDNLTFARMVRELSNGLVQLTDFDPLNIERIRDLNARLILDYSFGTCRIPDGCGIPVVDFCGRIGDKRTMAEIWKSNLSEKDTIIPTYLIANKKDLMEVLYDPGFVVKIAYCSDAALLGSGKGVVGKWSTSDEKRAIETAYQNDAILVYQPFIQPMQFTVPVKTGRSIAYLIGSNRICIKYWLKDGQYTPVAFEATIGPGDVPAKRGCTFTGVIFK